MIIRVRRPSHSSSDIVKVEWDLDFIRPKKFYILFYGSYFDSRRNGGESFIRESEVYEPSHMRQNIHDPYRRESLTPKLGLESETGISR